jgi:hypothetical protein
MYFTPIKLHGVGTVAALWAGGLIVPGIVPARAKDFLADGAVKLQNLIRIVDDGH